MMDPLTIGRVAAVHGFRVKVELDAVSKSPSRAAMAGVHTAIAINSYLCFEIGAGESTLGIITDLEARETIDPTNSGEMTLELVKPRRIASVQLLGTIRTSERGKLAFDPSVTVLPTLDTLARVATREFLETVFEDAPVRNQPEDVDEAASFDHPLDIGVPVASRENRLLGSYNDLFSRPLAVVGNTGSGKSYTVASLLQRALTVVGNTEHPRFFVLDINGEYGRAFDTAVDEKQPDTIYLNGQPFSVPIWLMNAAEVCLWLGAAEQTQEPVLKDFWSLAKGGSRPGSAETTSYMAEAVIRLDGIVEAMRPSRRPVNRIIHEYWGQFTSLVGSFTSDAMLALQDQIDTLPDPDENEYASFVDHGNVLRLVEQLKNELFVGGALAEALVQESADKPVHFPVDSLRDPKGLIEAVRSHEDDGRLRQWISTLQLRLNNRLADKRWGSFYSYDALELTSFEDWLGEFGVGRRGSNINVIDCSMLGHEVLPYVCGIVGRVLLECRERLVADRRFREPWVVVLEEAHNYVRPARQDEDRGIKISRYAFERIAKEGRKFGLSMIVASQRPSEVSQTIVSQCANFIMHRLQNPDDIEHFKSIVPIQSRRLLDQISILASGEAIAFGSAFHIPTRVQVHAPGRAPWSRTAAPYWEWQPEHSRGVDVRQILRDWGLEADNTTGSEEEV